MANELSVDIVLNGDEALRTLKAIEQGINKFSTSAASDIKKVDTSFSVFKGTLGTIAAVNFADFIKNQVVASINAFKQFETGLIAVAKTTNLSDKELASFEAGIESLVKKLPVASKELLDIAQAAGQLGVKGTKDLLNFTETIAKLGKSSDVSGSEAATALARILNVTKEGNSQIDELASSVVALGNDFAASESEIIRVATEVARAGSQFKITSAESVALGAALKSLGVRAEEGGSAISKVFLAIQDTVQKGGRGLDNFSKLLGLTGPEIAKQFGDKPIEIFQKFLEALTKTGKGSAGITEELKKLGLEGINVQKVIPALAASHEDLARAIDLANKETKNATALNKEFERFASSTESATQLLANAFEKLQRNIGEKFAPAIKAASPIIADFISRIGEDNVEAFARNATSIEKVRKELNLYQEKLKAISDNKFISFFQEDPEEVAGKINTLTGRLQELSNTSAKDELQKLNDQLTALNTQAALPVTFQFGFTGDGQLLPNPTDIEAKKALILEQIKNLNQQIALENNTLVEDNKATQATITEDNTAALQTRVDILAEFRAAQKEQEIAEKETQLTDKQIAADEDLQFLVDNLGRENTERELARIKQIDDEKKRNDELKKLNSKAREEEKAGIFNLRKFEDLTNKEKIAAQKDTLSAISTLSSSSNSALFAIGKASSLALAGINVAEGVTKALAAFPPPYNFAAAAAVGLAGAVSIARIASTPKPSAGNFATGGIVEGPSQSGDKLTANVNAGEAIFNKRQQENLFNAVNSGDLGGGGGGVTVNIQGDFLSNDQSVDKLIDSINDAVEFRNRKLKA